MILRDAKAQEPISFESVKSDNYRLKTSCFVKSKKPILISEGLAARKDFEGKFLTPTGIVYERVVQLLCNFEFMDLAVQGDKR